MMITIALPIQKRNGIRMLVNMVKTTILTFSFGDVVAKRRLESAGGATGSDMASTISAEDLAKVRKSLSESGNLPAGFSLKTQITGEFPQCNSAGRR